PQMITFMARSRMRPALDRRASMGGQRRSIRSRGTRQASHPSRPETENGGLSSVFLFILILEMRDPCARLRGRDDAERLELAMERRALHADKGRCPADVAAEAVDL